MPGMPAVTVLAAFVALALLPLPAQAQATQPDPATGKIVPGAVTPPYDATAGAVSSQSAAGAQPSAHDEETGKARKAPATTGQRKVIPMPPSKPVADLDAK